MTTPTLPLQQPPPLGTQRTPKRLLALVLFGIMVSTVAATASVIGARETRDSRITTRDDLQRNRDLLRSTCENTRAVTERFTTHSPAPCPTDFP